MHSILYNLPNRKISSIISRDVLRVLGTKKATAYLPYTRMKHLIHTTGELFYPRGISRIRPFRTDDCGILRHWDRGQEPALMAEGDYVYLDKYVQDCVFILRKLLYLSSEGSEGQASPNQKFIAGLGRNEIDGAKFRRSKRCSCHPESWQFTVRQTQERQR